ncbi:MAG: hypothetical protein PQJ59_16685 [Spirochaetales bacterium]|nr:hypothetical protein [Spirochaetales bacterium]
MNIANKVQRIKENDQDYEFYPTTEDMVRAVFNDLQIHKRNGYKKLLDIGAGDGNLFHIWNKLIDERFPRNEYGYRPIMMDVVTQYYAIEKSTILLEYLPKEVITIGTDFLPIL